MPCSPRPDVRVNQVGCLAAGPKRATWVTGRREPAAFTVVDGRGRTAFEGVSEPWPTVPEPTSGLPVHVLRFDEVRATGTGFVVRVAAGESRPFAIATDLYAGLARDALAFFVLQRSGAAITVPGHERPAGHPGDVAVPVWSGREAERRYPGWTSARRFDVSGGWYDAGDHGKYTTSTSVALAALLGTLSDDARRGRPPWPELVTECRVGLEWMLRMQVPPGEPYAGLAFHRVHGTTWAPLPCLPHADPTQRVLHRPSTAAGLHLAAVAAQGARLLGDDRALAAARVAWAAAASLPELRAPDDHGAFGGGPYPSGPLEEDRYWAAVELWLATGERAFGDVVTASPCHVGAVVDPRELEAPGPADAARLSLAAAGDAVARGWLADAGARLRAIARATPWGQPYAPADGGWDWGSNGRILDAAVLLLAAGDADAAAEALDMLLGRNALGQSYVCGYGADATHRVRARHFGHALDPAFPPPPPGALAGGPTNRDHAGFPAHPAIVGRPAQQAYVDAPDSETTNDVCVRWNAPLVRVARALT